jgi:hypothetical protein
MIDNRTRLHRPFAAWDGLMRRTLVRLHAKSHIICRASPSADALFTVLGIPKAGKDSLSVKQLVAKYGREPLANRQAIQQPLLRELRTPTPGGGMP